MTQPLPGGDETKQGAAASAADPAMTSDYRSLDATDEATPRTAVPGAPGSFTIVKLHAKGDPIGSDGVLGVRFGVQFRFDALFVRISESEGW